MRAIRFRRARHARRLACALLLCAGVVLAGCTAGPSTRPAVIAVDGGDGGTGSSSHSTAHPPSKNGARPLPPLTEPKSPSVSWTACDARTRSQLDIEVPDALRFECGQVFSVAKSPGHPLPVAAHLSLLKAGHGPIPLVIVNDVGRSPGTLYAARLAAQMPDALLDRFSLIGVNRRGTGSPHGLHCVPDRIRESIVGFDPTATSPQALLEAAQKATQQCVLHLDNTRQAYTTWQTASDLETVRKALGAEKLNAIGHGDGSKVLATYATRFPQQTGRLVLDGVPDPSTDAEQRARTRAAAAEQAFDAFARHCVERDCPLGSHPRKAVGELLSNLRSRPITAQLASERGTRTVEVTNGTALHALVRALPRPSSWPALAEALANAAHDDGDGVAKLVTPLLTGSPGQAARLDAQLVTKCNDQAQRVPPQKVAAASKSWREKDPMFGGYFAQRLALCTPWPVPSGQRQRPTADDAPPILVLSTAHDPVTPAVGTEHAAAQMDTAVLVKWQGTGHGALPASKCATRAATGYLTEGTIPTDGTVCPP